jgi:hypothetical protein
MPLITEVTLLTDVKALDTEIDGKIGEVQIAPTQYTVLERLKNIEANTLSTVPYQYIAPRPYSINKLFQRTVPTTNYANGQVVNDIGGQPQVFSMPCTAGSLISIKHIQISSSANLGTNPSIIIYNLNGGAISGQSQSDYQTFNPTYANTQNFDYLYFTTSAMGGFLTASPNVWTTVNFNVGGGALDFKMKVDSSSQLYYTIICNTAFTPIASQRIKVTITGDVLTQQ